MTAKAALCVHLLRGEVLNVKNVFTMIGLTNASREISRMIEKPFGVTISRTPRKGKSIYGMSVTWYDYRLNFTEYNREGVAKMREYVHKEMDCQKITTDKQLKHLKQTALF